MKRQKLYKFDPKYAVPPRATLCEIMEYYNLSVDDLAQKANCSPEIFSDVLKKKPIPAEAAEKLEQATGLSKQFWLNMDSFYRKQKKKLSK